jgi:hypothetical protein
MDHGILLALDTVDGLITRHAGAPRLVLQGPSGEERIETPDPLAELNRRAAATPITAFRLERPTLEEVFLRLTGRTLRD